MTELLSVINGVLEYSQNPLLQQVLDAGNNLLEKEKTQIINAYRIGKVNGKDHLINGDKNITAIQYYNETYGGKND